jgi:predicted AAA+ superfamily ATPase
MLREQSAAIEADLARKMVLLSGSRQVGKSWLAKHIASFRFSSSRYLNQDNLQDRDVILNYGWSTATDFLILDEIHKMPSFRI